MAQGSRVEPRGGPRGAQPLASVPHPPLETPAGPVSPISHFFSLPPPTPKPFRTLNSYPDPAKEFDCSPEALGCPQVSRETHLCLRTATPLPGSPRTPASAVPSERPRPPPPPAQPTAHWRRVLTRKRGARGGGRGAWVPGTGAGAGRAAFKAPAPPGCARPSR